MPKRDLGMNDNPLDAIEPLTLGTRLHEARKARGLTQQQVAERLGIARTTIVAIEKGRRRLKPGELIELASLLAQNVSEILQGVGRAPGFAEYQPPTNPYPLATSTWRSKPGSRGCSAKASSRGSCERIVWEPGRSSSALRKRTSLPPVEPSAAAGDRV